MQLQRIRERRPSFSDVAIIVLEEAQKPMTSAEIVRWAQKRSILQTDGRTPDKTLHAALSRSIARDPETPFRKNAGGRFDLRGRTYDAPREPQVPSVNPTGDARLASAIKSRR